MNEFDILDRDQDTNTFNSKIMSRGLMDLTSLGQWRTSSSKPEHQTKNLTDSNLNTYWQSDAELPHAIEVRFSKVVQLSLVGIYIDYVRDESYTPRDITIHAGFGKHALTLVSQISLLPNSDWQSILLNTDTGGAIECMFLRISILENQQNGRDSHVRQIKLAGPARGVNPRLDFGR